MLTYAQQCVLDRSRAVCACAWRAEARVACVAHMGT